jgi:Mg-chelatase subunit ChlD
MAAAAAATPAIQAKTFKVEGSHLYATNIKAPTAAPTHRQPVHLIALLDTSGSMEIENRLDNVIKSLSFLLDHMTATDFISIITFSGGATIEVRKNSLTQENKEVIRQKLSTLKPDGSTNMSAAILQAAEVFMKDPTIKECVLFLTDGEANQGLTNPVELVSLVKYGLAMNNSLSYSTVGYGTTHNTELLTSLATEGGGSYNVVANLEDTATVFGEVLGGLQSCIAQNIKLTYPDGTEFYTVYAITNKSVYVGDIQTEADIYVLSSEKPTALTGNILPTGEYFNYTPVETVPTEEEMKAANVAIIRYKVVQLMNEVRRQYGHMTTVEKEAKKQQIDEVIVQMDAQPANPMWSVLKKQLDDCKRMMDEPVDNTGHTTVLLSQHSACIGLGRGMIAGATESPFANSAQRHVSSGMRAHVSQDPSNNPDTL